MMINLSYRVESGKQLAFPNTFVVKYNKEGIARATR